MFFMVLDQYNVNDAYVTHICVAYTVREVASFQELAQLMGVVCKRIRARKLFVAYIETGTKLIYLR